MKTKNLPQNEYAANKFTDVTSIVDWSKGAIGAVREANIMSGYPDGTFKPTDYISRAEAVVALSKALESLAKDSKFYEQAGVYGPKTGNQNIGGDLTVKNAGITVQNTIIEGDLIIDKAVAQGSVILKNVFVKGSTYICGGGDNSIYFIDSQTGNAYVHKDDNDSIRIVVSGTSEIKQLIAQSSTKIQEVDLTGTGINSIKVDKKVDGEIEINLINVNINSIEVISEGVTINTNDSTRIGDFIAEAEVAVTGQGKIGHAIINADGVTFDTKPESLTVANGVSDPIINVAKTNNSGGGSSSASSTPTLSISPTSYHLNKNAVADIPINISWGNASNITNIIGSALGGAIKIILRENVEYTVQDNNDGTGILTIKKEVIKLLPVPIAMVPDGTQMTLTIYFDNNEERQLVCTVIGFEVPVGKGSISGQVRDNNGDPIANVNILLTPISGGYKRYAVTDTTGNYIIEGLVNDEYEIIAFADGWLRQEYASRVTVNEPYNTTDINFTLQLGGIISGKVLDGEGNPITNASVYAESINGDYGNYAITDANGTYAIKGLPSGGYRVQVYADCYIRQEYSSNVNVIAPNITSEIDITMQLGGSISGRVVGEKGNPIANASVFADSISGGYGSQVNTDGNGNYTIKGLVSGKYRVVVDAYGYIRQEYASNVNVIAPNTTSDINFTMQLGGSISGKVIDEKGNPIANASVSVNPISGGYGSGVITDANGNYTISGLVSGEYRVEVYADGYMMQEYDSVKVTAPNNTSDIDFVIQQEGSKSGRVEEEQSNPINNANVPEPINGEDSSYASTDSNGIYMSTSTSIEYGEVNPTVIVTVYGDSFTEDATNPLNWMIELGTTGLALDIITIDSDKQVTFSLNGTATTGTMILQSNSETITSGIASNTLTIEIIESTEQAIKEDGFINYFVSDKEDKNDPIYLDRDYIKDSQIEEMINDTQLTEIIELMETEEPEQYYDLL